MVKKMNILLLALYVLGITAAAVSGTAEAAGAAMLAGAEEAVRFCLVLAGALCLWSAVLELLEAAGFTSRLSALLRVPLGRLFPVGCREPAILDALSENVTANLLGLGNAATPAGLRAARGLSALGPAARDELCLLVVMNTASLQLVPGTIAAMRAAAGAASAFDILPAVWVSTLCSLAAGLLTASLLRRLWP